MAEAALERDWTNHDTSDSTSVSILTARPKDIGEQSHAGDEMGPRRASGEEDRLDRLERIVETLALAQAAPINGEKRRMNWFMASVAVITILGAGGNFVGSSGMWIGNRNRDADELKELKEQVGILNTWNEKLRNNMAAYGWLIDREGNVSRIEQSQPQRRR